MQMQKLSISNQIGIVPRWTIFIFDFSIAAIAFVFAYAVFYSFNLNAYLRSQFAIEIIYCFWYSSYIQG